MKKLLLIFLGLAGLTQSGHFGPDLDCNDISDFHVKMARTIEKDESITSESLHSADGKHSHLRLEYPTHGMFIHLTSYYNDVNLNYIFSNDIVELDNIITVIVGSERHYGNPCPKRRAYHHNLLDEIINIIITNIKTIDANLVKQYGLTISFCQLLCACNSKKYIKSGLDYLVNDLKIKKEDLSKIMKYYNTSKTSSDYVNAKALFMLNENSFDPDKISTATDNFDIIWVD